MNQTNRLRGDNIYYKLWFEAKNLTNVQDYTLMRERSTIPMKNCEWYNQNKMNKCKTIDLKMLIVYRSNIYLR